MKNLKVLITFILMGFICVGNVRAEVNISDADYARLRNVFSEARISLMTEEEVNKYLALDLENGFKETQYLKGELTNNNTYNWTEVNESEYESVQVGNNNSGIMPIYDDGWQTYVATTYKKLTMQAFVDSDGMYYLYLLLQWKYIPGVRSFDVIGFRYLNMVLVSNSNLGMQMYRLRNDNSFSSVVYSPNGANTVHKDNGFGTSMNIVNNDIVELECDLEAITLADTSMPYLFGSYQHAAENVTLAQSQSYNISGAGLGKVFNFIPAVESKYDAMSGVSLDLF